MSSALLLSDLHLPPEPSPLREGFLRLLAGAAREVEEVYILGDLFEAWIGDDAGLLDYAPEIKALRQLTDSGVAVYFLHGNRDFLIGDAFFAATGVAQLPDPALTELNGQAVLLSHGDLYCTADTRYQRWRRVSRQGWVKGLLGGLPLPWRRRLAQDLRGQSQRDKQAKPMAIMDVQPEAIEQAFREDEVSLLIHGHTHRPADHKLQVDGRDCRRLVLADWRPNRMEVLRADGYGLLRELV